MFKINSHFTHEFSADPIKIHHIDISLNKISKTYVFIGTVAENVRDEFKNIQKNYNENRKIRESKILTANYGKNWKSKFFSGEKKGGGEIDEFGLEDIDIGDISTETNDVSDKPADKPNKAADKPTPEHTIEFCDINIYPIDKVSELKLKIFIATRIPIYRQHLFYKNSYTKKNVPLNYIFLKHSNVEYINIENLFKNKNADIIENIPVILDYYNNKDFLQIESNDNFILIEQLYKNFSVTDFYLVDLNDLVDKNNLAKITKDTYQMEMIYYGFILPYFPIITYQVFADYVHNEELIKESYPDLYPTYDVLKNRFDKERYILNEIYELYENEKLFKSISSRIYTSIKETTINLVNYRQEKETIINIRHLFDEIELDDQIIFVKAHLIHNNRQIILKKTKNRESDPQNEINLYDCILLKIKTNVKESINEFMNMIIYKNGNYSIQTEWREENHMTFDTITQIVIDVINPIINRLNKMPIKYYNQKITLVDKHNINFTKTSSAFYYEGDITDSNYLVIRNIVADYAKAGFLIVKEGSYLQEYFFLKGMYKYDSARLDKLTNVQNYYEYFSSAVVKSKWATLFEKTRLMQMINVSSKLKISISGIRDQTEIQIFSMFLLGIIKIFLKNTVKLVKSDIMESKSQRALKNLKVNDPLLYDFKKIYNSKIVYSRICQKQYLPLLLTDEEYEKLPADRKKNAVQYWNFTKEKPVWYSCPNQKYPYLKYIIKKHPKDFCLPCCKKVEMNERVNVKKQEIHNICMKNHIYVGEKINLTKGSHYISTYGKDIETGRLCRLPENTLEPLFFDVYSDSVDNSIDAECMSQEGYYLMGVEQNLRNIKCIGYLFCLVFSLDVSYQDFIFSCVEKLKEAPEYFPILHNGQITKYFVNVEALIGAIRGLDSEMFETDISAEEWNKIFISIAYYYYGINTILFSDRYKEYIELMLPTNLKNVADMFPDTHKNMVIIQKKNKYYPIYLINLELYKRIGAIDTRIFFNESAIISTIKSVVKTQLKSENNKSPAELSTIKEFLTEHANYGNNNKNATYDIDGYFINNNNMVYGVLININSSGEKAKARYVYVPVNEASYAVDKNIELIFTPYSDKFNCQFVNICEFINKYNTWAGLKNKKFEKGLIEHYYDLIEIKRCITVANPGAHDAKSITNKTQIIGLYANNLYFYFMPVDYKTIKDYYGTIEVFPLLYEPQKINTLIEKIKNKKVKINNFALNRSLYEYYIYYIIYLEFTNIFGKQKNKEKRKKLYTIIAKTNFKKDLAELREFYAELEQEDKAKLKNLINKFMISMENNKQILVETLEATFFEFDRVELEKLKNWDRTKIIRYLKKIAGRFVKIGQVGKIGEFPNKIEPCSENKNMPYCAGNRVIIDQKKLNNFIEIIANDILNPLKWKWLFNPVFLDMTFDYFKFKRRPGEIIYLEFI